MFREVVLNAVVSSVDKFGNSNAFCIDETFYTYNEFAKRISAIRASLQLQPLVSKQVGLVTNDNIDTYAAIFALWLEGLSYVPLHPHQPIARLLEIVVQAEIKLVINSAENDLIPHLPTIYCSGLEFTDLKLEIKPISENELAYILFTSGSTGKPKGVPITRGNVGSFLKSFWETGLKITHEDRCLQGYELTFDLSVQSYLVPLTKGACTYTIPPDQIKYSYLYGLLDDHQLTFLPIPPSLIRFLRPYFKEINYLCVRYVLLGAEASQVDLISEWAQCIPQAEIYNFYGPTEATIYCTYSKFNRNGETKNSNGLMHIGKPMNGNVAIIVDENLKVLEENSKGELCISGNQLTSGYLNNAEKNNQSFFELTYDGAPRRFYKTGDLCYIDNEGDIIYGGRLDYQVKVQGYRIELGEIEYHAREFLAGSNAVALTLEDKLGNTEIALFVEGDSLNEKALADYLKTRIPGYMIPTKFIKEKVFPLNNSGKIDRNVLKTLITV